MRRIDGVLPQDLLTQFSEVQPGWENALRFHAIFSGNRKTAVDLREFPMPGLARQVLRLLREETQPSGSMSSSPGAVVTILSALRVFGDFCVITGRAGRISAFEGMTGADIDAFEEHLVETRSARSTANTYAAAIIRLVRAYGASHQIEASLKVRVLASTSIPPPPRGATRDSYSDNVVAQVQAAARIEVRAAIARMTAEAPEILKRGQDPGVGGWNRPENLLWAMYHQRLLSPADVRSKQPKLAPRLYSYRSFSGGDRSFVDWLTYLHLDAATVLPFVILIGLGTGLPIESLKELEAHCLSGQTETKANLKYIKRRKGAGEDPQSLCFDRASPDSPIRLIETVIELTRFSRSIASPAVKEWLFIGTSQTQSGLQRLGVGPKDAARFCQRHEIFDDEGQRMTTINLSRLRKTFKAKQYREHAELASTAGDHSVQTFNSHYASVKSLDPLHAQTMEDALQEISAIATASTIIPDAPEVSAEAPVDEPDGEDVWTASCRDVHSSPFNSADDAGKPCRSPVWGCLSCRNAVISEKNLPAILAFLDHILDLRSLMSLAVWHRKFGRAHALITESILPRFSTKALEQAQDLMAIDRRSFLLPVELSASNQ